MSRRVILDVSSYQGSVNFALIKQQSPEVVGVIIKATEGDWKWTNPSFDEQIQSALAAGLAVGAYCFEHPGDASTNDAQMFLDRIAGYHSRLALGVWLDCEVSDGVPASQILPRILADANLIAQNYPMKTGFYTADWWWGPNTIGSVQAHMENWPLWVAGYTQSLPQLPVPWTHPIMWQFTDAYPTYLGRVDASVFLGTDAQWNWLVTGSVTPTPGPAPAPAPKPLPSSTAIKRIQAATHAVQDGIWGPDTEKRAEVIRHMRMNIDRQNRAYCKYLQEVLAFPPAACDGIWGPITASHWLATVKLFQQALGVPADGIWGTVTDGAFLKLDPLV